MKGRPSVFASGIHINAEVRQNFSGFEMAPLPVFLGLIVRQVLVNAGSRGNDERGCLFIRRELRIGAVGSQQPYGLGLEVASPDEARQILKLKGGDKVAF